MNWKERGLHKILTWLRITNRPVVKVYRGYGRSGKLLVQGHVLRRSPLSRKRYRRHALVNMFAVLRLFLVRPYVGAVVRLNWPGQVLEVETDPDGFFQFEWASQNSLTPGWHPVAVELVSGPPQSRTVLTSGSSELLVPHPTHYACISDIDDTFLVSHAASVRKKFFVLLTENAHSRTPFEGVVRHYNLLSRVGTTEQTPNAFFYVSSSEWNLYDYILDFSVKNELPKGVYKLNHLKLFAQLWQTGGNNHQTKRTRIARIMDTFPEQIFILLGDDNQEDPSIYAAIVEQFPGRVRCVYLRHLNAQKRPEAQKYVDRMEAAGVTCCYFVHSAEAMRHTEAIGL